MKPLALFHPYLLPYVRGCPDPMMSDALVESAILFCEETDAVQHTTEPVLLTSGASTLELDLPSDQKVQRVLDVWADLSPLKITAPQNAGSPRFHFDNVVGQPPSPTGRPTHALVREPNSVTVTPAPDRPYAITATVSLRPTRAARQLADPLFDDWANAIAFGAIARLAALPGTTFENPNTVAYASAQFSHAIGKARVESSKGKTRADLRVRMRAWP